MIFQEVKNAEKFLLHDLLSELTLVQTQIDKYSLRFSDIVSTVVLPT